MNSEDNSSKCLPSKSRLAKDIKVAGLLSNHTTEVTVAFENYVNKDQVVELQIMEENGVKSKNKDCQASSPKHTKLYQKNSKQETTSSKSLENLNKGHPLTPTDAVFMKEETSQTHIWPNKFDAQSKIENITKEKADSSSASLTKQKTKPSKKTETAEDLKPGEYFLDDDSEMEELFIKNIDKPKIIERSSFGLSSNEEKAADEKMDSQPKCPICGCESWICPLDDSDLIAKFDIAFEMIKLAIEFQELVLRYLEEIDRILIGLSGRNCARG